VLSAHCIETLGLLPIILLIVLQSISVSWIFQPDSVVFLGSIDMKFVVNERTGFRLLALLLIATLHLSSIAADSGAGPYSPYVDRPYPADVYWGDTHLHTNLSVDANGMGNSSLTPDDAYRFAKGETITAHNGQQVRLQRPLDFMVVADHAVNIGVIPRAAAGDPLLLTTETGRRWAKWLKDNPMPTGEILNAESDEPFKQADASTAVGGGHPRSFFWSAWAQGYVANPAFRRSVWSEVGANAERHNQPGKFTAFIGFEWTPATGHPKSPNLHRNIIFEGGTAQTNQVLPFSIQDSDNVEDLWAYLKNYEDTVGGKVLAIAHNGNLSSGAMFALKDYHGRPLSEDYANSRSRWEPLYEVTQIKGDGETHPILSPTDEFANYERWHGKRTANWEEQKKTEYARSALQLGLQQKVKLGVNPFKFGMIGSTDAHTSLSAVREDNFWGKKSLYEPSPHRLASKWYFSAAGYAAVWAHQNTRESLFAAMRRKETYASTGPRMTVRFFGGWEFESGDATSSDFAGTGYRKGVPMGGDLTQAPKGTAPGFLIRAVKDPDGANLDRLQVIKGWRDRKGVLHEKIYNVALSDDRKEDSSGKVPAVGNTVSIADASYTNSIGDAVLAVVWTDPDFNKRELAFYYARVLEIPTPRWTAYDAKNYRAKDLPENAPMITQERAYTSPIWYTP
jgi:hypothetical protein